MATASAILADECMASEYRVRTTSIIDIFEGHPSFWFDVKGKHRGSRSRVVVFRPWSGRKAVIRFPGRTDRCTRDSCRAARKKDAANCGRNDRVFCLEQSLKLRRLRTIFSARRSRCDSGRGDQPLTAHRLLRHACDLIRTGKGNGSLGGPPNRWQV